MAYFYLEKLLKMIYLKDNYLMKDGQKVMDY